MKIKTCIHGSTFYLYNVEVLFIHLLLLWVPRVEQELLIFSEHPSGVRVARSLYLTCPAQRSDDTSLGVVQIQMEAVYQGFMCYLKRAGDIRCTPCRRDIINII